MYKDNEKLKIERLSSTATMRLLVGIFSALLSYVVAQGDETIENLRKTTVEIIREADYTAESHRVTTEDGYILTMHRIPSSPTSPAAKNKPIVFLMHGILLSSADWVLTGPGKGFAFILADAGYDVWMGNARGNVYSRGHVNSNHLTEKKYWHFDWHEIGYYDLPAMIDYILELTGEKNLVYIGHSQGTAAFYVLTSLRPEYNEKTKVMFSLAPVAYIGNIRSPVVVIIAPFVNQIEVLTQLIGVYEIKPSGRLLTLAGKILCNDKALTQDICSNFLFLLFGYDHEQLNSTLLPTVFGHFPVGSSIRQLAHFGQEKNSKKFRWYDHGPIKNLRVYGSLEPPDYNLAAITTRINLIYGENDFLAVPEDVKHLYSKLRNASLTKVPFPKWNHIDFLWGIDAPKLVYEPILNTLRRNYNN